MARTRAIGNTLRNSLRPGYTGVMLSKVFRRRGVKSTRKEATAWAVARKVNPAEWCKSTDAVLWEETKEYGEDLRRRAKALSEDLGRELVGGARFELLYFLTRLHRPKVVVETGVASGFSSSAFLEALERNGAGHLFSSDFPYFRSKDPESLVGVLVPEHLRHRWTLLLRGDEHNLPEILDRVEAIDFFHYDSDKSYAGRRYAVDLVMPRLAAGGAVLMDDIQDNLFFRDWVSELDVPYLVFGPGSFCVGAIGL